MRRKFIKNTALAMGGLPFAQALSSLPFQIAAESNIDIYATNWGFKGSVDAFCKKAKAAGYAGIEVWAPTTDSGAEELKNAVKAHELKLGLLAGNWGNTFEAQLESYKQSVGKGIRLQPVFINSHSGKDFYSIEQNSQFLEFSFEASEQTGIPIYHETHRGRMMYAAPVAKSIMDKYDQLRVTLDISHWCCVHESLLADQPEVVQQVLDRTDHIHARIGFPEGPQIPRPEDPKFEQAVQTHFGWWDQVVQAKAAADQPLTMTAEFGPPPYMWTEPFTGEPLADVWEVNVLMKDMWTKRYNL